MPAQVRNAIRLLWFLLAAGAVAMLVGYDSFAAEMGSVVPASDFAIAAAVGIVVAFGGEGLLIVLISRRKNWARILQLLLTLGGFASLLWPESYPDPVTWDLVVSNVGFTGLELLALYWLFTGPVRAWFGKAVP